MLLKLFFSKARGRTYTQISRKAPAKQQQNLGHAFLVSAFVTASCLALSSAVVDASNNDDKGQTKEELLEEVKSVFPKASRKQLEAFVEPLYAEFVAKYPRGMDFKAFLYESDIADRELGKVIFRAIDTDRNGTISVNEWVFYCATEASDDPQGHLDFQFRAYDANGDGYILKEELIDIIRVLTRHGDLDLQKIQDGRHRGSFRWSHGISSAEELADITLAQCDTNHDHRIDKEEFRCVSAHLTNYIKNQQTPQKQNNRRFEMQVDTHIVNKNQNARKSVNYGQTRTE